jgi:predicted nucleic acid-binding protein
LPQVQVEFQRRVTADTRFHGLAFPGFIQLSTPLTTDHAWAHSPVLHAGEIAALSLALERGADLVLMDEAEGRAAATAMHLTTMGLLGILI